MNYSAQEIKTGMVVTTAVILLTGLTFAVGNFSKVETVTKEIRFGYVAGLKKNAPVYASGHEVGRVETIEEVEDAQRPVRVMVQIPKSLVLHEDSIAFINNLELMGEKGVELEPGTSMKPVLKPEAVIEAVDPVRMYRLLQKVNVLTGQIEDLVGSLNPIFKGSQEQIAGTVANLHEASANLRDMTHDLKLHPWRLLKKG